MDLKLATSYAISKDCKVIKFEGPEGLERAVCADDSKSESTNKFLEPQIIATIVGVFIILIAVVILVFIRRKRK